METRIAFVNFTKAFGKVNITKLFEILTNDNIPQQIMQNIYNLHKTNMIPVKTESRQSEWNTWKRR